MEQVLSDQPFALMSETWRVRDTSTSVTQITGQPKGRGQTRKRKRQTSSLFFGVCCRVVLPALCPHHYSRGWPGVSVTVCSVRSAVRSVRAHTWHTTYLTVISMRSVQKCLLYIK